MTHIRIGKVGEAASERRHGRGDGCAEGRDVEAGFLPNDTGKTRALCSDSFRPSGRVASTTSTRWAIRAGHATDDEIALALPAC